MPKSKELLDSDDSYASDENKPRSKKMKTSTAANANKKKEIAPPTNKKSNGTIKDDEENEVETKITEGKLSKIIYLIYIKSFIKIFYS